MSVYSKSVSIFTNFFQRLISNIHLKSFYNSFIINIFTGAQNLISIIIRFYNIIVYANIESFFYMSILKLCKNDYVPFYMKAKDK